MGHRHASVVLIRSTWRVPLVLALAVVACGDSADSDRAGSSIQTTTSTSNSSIPSTTSTTTTTTTSDALEVTLGPEQCASLLSGAFGSINVDRVDERDGIDDEEIADVLAQVERVESQRPDLGSDGRCAEHFENADVARQALAFLPERTIRVLQQIPGMDERDGWRVVLAAHDETGG